MRQIINTSIFTVYSEYGEVFSYKTFRAGGILEQVSPGEGCAALVSGSVPTAQAVPWGKASDQGLTQSQQILILGLRMNSKSTLSITFFPWQS